MEEIWKDLENYEGFYKISNLGNIKGLLLYDRHKDIYNKREKILKPDVTSKGYLRVTLCKNGVKKRYTVHRLVAQNFIENPNNLSQINHINGIKTDNRADNLEWCTNGENEKHAYKIGLKAKKFGEENPKHKSIIAINLITKEEKIYGSIIDAVKELNIGYNTIIYILKGKTKKPKKYNFRYMEV